MELGEALYERMQYGDAEAAFRAALDAEPGHLVAQAYVALCLCHRQETTEAERTARQAVAWDDEFAWGHYVLGYVLMLQDKPRLALRSVERSLELNPSSPLAHALSSHLLSYVHKWEPALARAAEARALDPECSLGALAYAVAQRGLKDYEAAEECLIQYLMIHPDDPEVLEQLGWISLDQDKPRLALESFQRAKVHEGIMEARRRHYRAYRWLTRSPRWMRGLSLLLGLILGYLFPVLLLPLFTLGSALCSVRPLCNGLLWTRGQRLNWTERAETFSVLLFLTLAGVSAVAGFRGAEPGEILAGHALIANVLMLGALGCESGPPRNSALLLVAGMLYLDWGGLWHPQWWQFWDTAFVPVVFMLTLASIAGGATYTGRRN